MIDAIITYMPFWPVQSQHKHREREPEGHEIVEVHGTLMMVAWLGLMQLGVWSHYFRYSRWSILVHMVSMLSVVVLSLIAMAIVLATQGAHILWKHFYHQTIGFFLVICLLPITVIYGGAARLLSRWYGVQPNWIITAKQGHRRIGWLTVFLFKIPLLTGLSEDGISVALAIVLVDAASYAVYWYLKTHKQTIEQVVVCQLRPCQGQPTISLEDYNHRFGGRHFMFANYIYKLEPIITSHPGGHAIIEHVRDREIDRFVYGMEVTEKMAGSPLQPHSHRASFIELVESPRSQIIIPEAFSLLSATNTCLSSRLYTNKDRSMWIVYLKTKEGGPARGYISVEQLGRFRALRVDGVTRLYSNVQFLRRSNLKFMSTIMGSEVLMSYQEADGFGRQQEMQQKRMQLSESLLEMQDVDEGIPLFIKKYEIGTLTSTLASKLSSANFSAAQVLLSQSRGFGLGLTEQSDKNPIRIVIFAGGTGIHPYGDLLDLKYKAMLIEQEHSSSSLHLQQNPILEKKPFRNYSFVIYFSVDSIAQVHPVTFFQMLELSKHDLLELNLKTMQLSPELLAEYPSIRPLPLTFRFESAVEPQIQKNPNTHFSICGPGAMSKQVVEKLEFLGVSRHQFRII